MRPHRTDLISLSFGLVFLSIAGWWAGAQLAEIRLPWLPVGWAIAILLVVIGISGIATALRGSGGGVDSRQE